MKSAQFGVQIAEYELELAKAAMLRTVPDMSGDTATERFEIFSPIDGRVLRVFQESSTVVTAGERLVELGDPTDLEVEVDVLSTDAVKIRPGAKVVLEHWGGEAPLVGRVRLVEPAAFLKVSALGVEEQRVNVLIDFVDPPEKRGAIGDAYRVEARIVVWEAGDALKVPTGAMFRQADGWSVFRVEGGRAELKRVKIGQRNDAEAEVIEGLAENDRVIVYPSDKVKEWVRVRAR